ncbi:MAG: hypothetical protein EPGJADBJ_03107 [Saprospiraceae bacterium]|nr:hypothetical protein [Saprospiraceae bacterium]
MNIELIALFFIIAAVYASAGFGGGSSYLAAMAVFGLGMNAMRPAALLCNIAVVAGGTWIYWNKGLLNLRKILPLCAASIPLSFLGGLTPLKEKTFFLLLGACLTVSALLMMFQKSIGDGQRPYAVANDGHLSPATSATLGGGIGYLSGVVGIGGGIFLSPVLHLMRWDAPKNIAATASFFILVNSIFGLAGQFWSGRFQLDLAFILPLLAAVVLGGQIGSHLSVFQFRQTQVRWITAVLVLYAGVNILWKNI